MKIVLALRRKHVLSKIVFSLMREFFNGFGMDFFMLFGSFSVNFGIEEGFKIELKFHIDFQRDLGSLGARLGTPLAPIWEPCGGLGGALALKVDAWRGQKLDKNRILAPRSLQDAFGTPFYRILKAWGPVLGCFL